MVYGLSTRVVVSNVLSSTNVVLIKTNSGRKDREERKVKKKRDRVRKSLDLPRPNEVTSDSLPSSEPSEEKIETELFYLSDSDIPPVDEKKRRTRQKKTQKKV